MSKGNAVVGVLLIVFLCSSVHCGECSRLDVARGSTVEPAETFGSLNWNVSETRQLANTEVFLNFNSWVNRILLGFLLPNRGLRHIPHFVQTWIRNYSMAILTYFLSAGLWCLYIYHWKRDSLFPAGDVPDQEPIRKQIYVTMQAIPLYSLLPTASEYFMEKGWTRCYAEIGDLGWANYCALTFAYLVFVEFCIYWIHRGLHDIKPLYRWLHATHHIYNKQNTLSPFAGLAFNPIDGILQGCPHAVALFIVPTHFLTHIGLLFLEGIWTTNIHDCLHGNVWAVMGAGYHTIHHTTYRHNYGHYTIFMDWFFGTLKEPDAKSIKDD